MSFAGLKKQINKANQYVSERVGAAEATKLDECYQELEKVCSVYKLIQNAIGLTFLCETLLKKSILNALIPVFSTFLQRFQCSDVGNATFLLTEFT
ncbi:hypothetical protein D918_04702 [Trichuris suis]|nr:hypothetical protein D918_04702 [Trichuris suis]